MNFFLKVLRNSAILSIGYFVSNLNSFEVFCYEEFKPLIVFTGLYIFAELANHYHLTTNLTTARAKSKITTLIF